jgi:hypothetical protein
MDKELTDLFKRLESLGFKCNTVSGTVTNSPNYSLNNRIQFNNCVPVKVREVVTKYINNCYTSPRNNFSLLASL